MSDKTLDMNKIPKHIAFILDGNGRWAKNKKMPRTYGHEKGAHNVAKVVKECKALGVECVTVYAFSTENWTRPESEVNFIMTKPIEEFKKNKHRIKESDVKVKFIGRRTKFSKELLDIIEEVEAATKDNTGITLCIAADYGSQMEITDAIKNIAIKYKNEEINLDDINNDLVTSELYTAGLPELDLLVRTSGEQRISNFLLWQLSYSELYFTNTHWPAFNKKELHNAILSYQNRNRRFGGLKKEK